MVDRRRVGEQLVNCDSASAARSDVERRLDECLEAQPTQRLERVTSQIILIFTLTHFKTFTLGVSVSVTNIYTGLL